MTPAPISTRPRRSGIRARLRLAGLVLTAFLPQPAKRLAYKWAFGYRIGKGVRIGVTLLDCDHLNIDDYASVGHGTVFWQCGTVSIGTRAIVGPLNLFRGGREIVLGEYSQVMRLNIINAIIENDCTNSPDSSFRLGYGSTITAEHRVYFTDRVTIGRCSILGGRGSSIWTHNVRIGRPVTIGDYCYVGSEIRMAPGSAIPDCSVLGLGSVVTKPITDRYSFIAGVPARIRRPLTEADHSMIFGKPRPDLPDERYPDVPSPRGDVDNRNALAALHDCVQ